MSQIPMFGQPDEATDTPEDITEMLPVFDYGYFDALVAIGFAALADAYFNTEESPLIERGPAGFSVTYTPKPRENPDLGWLRYSIGKKWPQKEWFVEGRTKSKDAPYIEDAVFLKEVEAKREEEEGPKYEKVERQSAVGSKGEAQDLPEGEKWRVKPSYFTLVDTEGAAVSLSEEEEWISVPDRSKFRNPIRELYATINSLRTSNAPWFNLCVYLCRNRGEDLIENKDLAASEDAGEEVSLEKGIFKDDYVTLNATLLPQASKGANSERAFSITNGSLGTPLVRSLSRRNCFAVAGLLYAAVGHYHLPTKGFSVPVPQRLRLEDVRWISSRNRRRFVPNGFFFQYDNYLNLVRQLLTYREEEDLPEAERTLFSVAGANFIELGEQGKPPQGPWQFVVPNHGYTIDSVEQLRQLLGDWREKNKTRLGKEASVDRAAVRQLVRGFERSDPLDAAEGYLAYVFDVGLCRKENNQDVTYTALPQPFFKEIMSHTHSDLLRECQSDEVRRFIDLVRRETYNTIYPSEEQRAVNYHEKVQPNYAMMRKLREVQDTDDFTETITEIAVERGTKRIAMEKGDSEEKEFLAMPYEPSISKLVELAEKHDARLVAQVVLSLALCRRPYDGDGNGDNEDDAETKETEEATSAKA
jgi:hypothetical protein